MSRYYDIDGQPLEFVVAMMVLEDGEARTVGRTERGDVTVSTVHLVIDHSFGVGPPLIFETMIFGGTHDGEQWRYPTRAEAEEGHRAACEIAFGPTSATDDRPAVISEKP